MSRGFRRRYYNYANMPNMSDDAFEDNCCSYVDNMYTEQDECECGFGEEYSSLPTNPLLGQSYVPWQIMNKTFTPEVGLKMGTIFPELVFTYMPGQSKEEIEYIKRRNEVKGGCNDE